MDVRPVPPPMNAIADVAGPAGGIAVTSAPSSGLPSEVITVPVMRARRTGASAKSVFCASWPIATVTRCAFAAAVVPGKYVGA